MSRVKKEWILIAMPGFGLLAALCLLFAFRSGPAPEEPRFTGAHLVTSQVADADDGLSPTGARREPGNSGDARSATPGGNEMVTVKTSSQPRAQTFSLALVDEHGNPLQNAKVTWIARPAFVLSTAEQLNVPSPLAHLNTQTDAQGKVEFAREDGMAYELVVEAEGYPKKHYRLIDPGHRTIQVTAAVVIAGRLTDEDTGVPVVDATVELWNEFGPSETTTSDIQGRYEFRSVAADQRVTLRVLSAEHQRQARTFFLDEGGGLEYQAFELRPGGTLNVEVVDADGEAIPDADLRLIELNSGLAVAQGRSDDRGEAVFGAVKSNRQYLVEAHHADFGNKRQLVKGRLREIGEGPLSVRVVIQGTWKLQGSVNIAGPGQIPLEGAQVILESKSAGPYASASRHRPAAVTTDASGAFEVQGLLRGVTYSVLVYHADFAMQIEPSVSEPVEGQAVQTLAVEMFNGHRFEGQVLDSNGLPVPQASVFISWDSAGNDHFGGGLGNEIVITADDQGRYVIDKFPSQARLRIGAVDRLNGAIIRRGEIFELKEDTSFISLAPKP